MDVLDTNVIIRYLTDDHDQLSQRARAAFAELESGSRTLYLPESVLVETAQVLGSKRLYALPRQVIATHLGRLLEFPGVELSNRRSCRRAVELFATAGPLSLVDCLCVAHAERLGDAGVLSFDRGFDRTAVTAETHVRRREPS